MTNIIERHGDNIRNAIKYVDEKLREETGKSVHQLISEAGARHNLSPKDEEYLTTFFKQRKEFEK
ncbi:MAG: hypothetical protein GY866_00795 [Proteobacteria bacterium]|nr:hypothetical protein [Pseudomonadota bacterium]